MASLDMGTVTSLRAVMAQLKEQHPSRIIMAPDMEAKVWSASPFISIVNPLFLLLVLLIN